MPKYLPTRAGKKVHYSTVYRWVTKGSRGHVLDSMMVGGIRYTTIEAVYRFLAAKPAAAKVAAANYDHEIEEALRKAGV